MRFRATVTVAAAAVGAALLTAAPAHASSYDHKDPYKSGCGNSAYPVRTAAMKFNGTKVGKIQLMWSPRCRTNWTEIRVPSGQSGTIWVETKKKRDTFHYKAGNGGRHWGDMLTANGVCAWGSAAGNGKNSGDSSNGKTTRACGRAG